MREYERGSALLELVIGLGVAAMLSTTAITLMNNQIGLIKAVRDRGFIVRDGGTLQASMQKLGAASELCTVHTTLAAAQSWTNAVRSGGAYLRFWSGVNN